ncbi:MAG: type I methionyl aminopeptidase [Lachnospiraceae bacterium]|nr:type I methionyl aminopeptidase [Lachnospiraceae bacterium]
MSVSIKSEKEIARMREAGKILSEVHDRLAMLIVPGITTKELDRKAFEMIRAYGCIPSFLNYNGFPASICASVNEEVIHGIPDKKRVLKEGDIISIDAGVIFEGYHSDAARTHAVGQISPEAEKLIRVTKQSFFEGIKFARAGCHLFEISAAVEDHVVANGFSCVRDYVGHGVGANLHEEPEVPNFRQKRRGIKLVPGMTLAVEPMVNIGKPDICVLENEWTVVTEDGTLSAHYENTILITEGEPEILSLQM